MTSPEVVELDLRKVESGAVIGRAPECEIHVDHPSVSRRHARLVREPVEELGKEAVRWRVEDLGSMSGTYLNEKIVRSAFLERESFERKGLERGAEQRKGLTAKVTLRVGAVTFVVSGLD
jgi:pSer/pThr/pTyr-binding forkhead associated (FHA) protein